MTTLPHWAQCWIHNASEVQTESSYKVCGECWHVWQTEADFRVDVEQLYHDVFGVTPQSVPPLEKIYSCPHCAHDF